MRTRTAGAVFGIALAFVATGVAAAPWQSISQRQAKLDQQIDSGVSGGALDKAEAERLRTEFRSLEAREVEHRNSGGSLTRAERVDLDQRFGALSKRITEQQSDGQVRK